MAVPTITAPLPAVCYEFPLAIAHRGYRAAFPENSMAAFRGATAVGAHGLETDVHLSADGVVVLSHDPSLKRCFGVDRLVRDCDWPFLATLRTLGEPHEPLARLSDLLAFMATDEGAQPWLLLDVKMDDDATALFAGIRRALDDALAGDWGRRVLVGCWTASWLRLSRRMLPELRPCYIGMSSVAAGWLLWRGDPEVQVWNLKLQTLVGPVGAAFRQRAAARGDMVCAWTVNNERWMRWCVRRRISGVVTDDPKLFLDVCRRMRVPPSSSAGVAAPALARHGRGPAWWEKIPMLTMQLLLFVCYPIFIATRPSAERPRPVQRSKKQCAD